MDFFFKFLMVMEQFKFEDIRVRSMKGMNKTGVVGDILILFLLFFWLVSLCSLLCVCGTVLDNRPTSFESDC